MTAAGFTPPLEVLRLRDRLDDADTTACPRQPVYGHEWIAAADGVHCIHCPLVVTGDDSPAPSQETTS